MPLIFKFTMPLLLGNLLQQTYSLIDAAIVGKFLGISPLAAVGASSSVIFLILGFCNGCCCGFGIPVAQKFGARDYESMRRYVYSSLKLTAWLSVSIAVVTSLLCAAILRWMSTPENIFSDAYWYLLITFIGVPATFYYNLLSSIIRALGDSKTPTVLLACGLTLNIIFEPIAILVFGWGIPGAALATLASQVCGNLLCLFFILRKVPALRTHRKDWCPDFKLYWEHLRIALPMGFQSSIIAIGAVILQVALNDLGPTAVAAYAAAQKIESIAMMPMMSFGIAMSAYTAQNYGARKFERIGEGVRKKFEEILVPAGMGDVAIFTEMGRFTTGPYGALVATAIHEKHIYKEYIGLDACAANLMRPAMYGAYHHITVLGKENEPCDHMYDVVGGLCENNDKFAIDRMLPKIDIGDIVYIHDTGAHGSAMGYNYNGKLRSAEVLLCEDGTHRLIRRAETPRDYFATLDFLPLMKPLFED